MPFIPPALPSPCFQHCRDGGHEPVPRAADTAVLRAGLGALQEEGDLCGDVIGAHFGARDLLLTPTLPEVPVKLGTYGQGAEQADGPGWPEHLFHRSPFTAAFNIAFNVAGAPAMSVPLACDPATGMPIGVRFAAGYVREDVLFRLAAQLERAAPWAERKPAVRAGSAQPARS
ncbi:amidase family protein [Streptomyces sp. MB09-01]|uniref:amidase family protein n=1 Tax=Streptomyces sp. MB09-01 TaxID=3028666 RepID=UPI003A5C4ED9